ncbi:hypothetical protein [uncultured Ilyobacter sp.]|uniref:hypothetical protein n=1 Tax=uncultured Ilyobacter sp. TaxID=544433 RepID=UPI0029C6024C|nr:hypothetical protein [uncultured Ilyobacter sp.]
MKKIEINLLRDYEEELIKVVLEKSSGKSRRKFEKKLPQALGNEDLILKYELAIIKSKKVKFDGIKREIYYSNNFKKKLINLTSDKNQRVQKLENFLLKGDLSLNDKSNKYLNDASYEFFNLKEDLNKKVYLDSLLLNLNITHYHLTKDDLIYLIYTKHEVYFLDIGLHNRIYDYEYFIKLLESEKLDKLLPPKLNKINGCNNYSIKEIKNFITNNVLFIMQGNKGMYMSYNPVSTAGPPINFVRNIDNRVSLIENWEENILRAFSNLEVTSLVLKVKWKYSNFKDYLYIEDILTGIHFIIYKKGNLIIMKDLITYFKDKIKEKLFYKYKTFLVKY